MQFAPYCRRQKEEESNSRIDGLTRTNSEMNTKRNGGTDFGRNLPEPLRKIESQHWRARFSKALALSYLPSAFGKKMEAIQQLETLAESQAELPSRPEHVETFIALGDLYDGEGISSGTYDSWRKGLEAFPKNPRLRERLENSEIFLRQNR